MQSKILFFSILAIILGINIGCGKKFAENIQDKHIIPYVPVYTQIDLGIGGENPNWTDRPRYFNLSYDGKALGYRGHGIIIYSNNNTDFVCYDATCTNCTDLTSYFTQKDLEGWKATCPVCGTQFLLIQGTPTNNEKEIYPLKSYYITKSSNKLIVSN